MNTSIGLPIAALAFLLGCGQAAMPPSAAPEAADSVDGAASSRRLATDGGETSEEGEVRKFCASCHVFPEPSTLPRRHWKEMVEKMYAIAQGTSAEVPIGLPPMQAAIAYYTERAELEFPDIPHSVHSPPGGVKFRDAGLQVPQLEPYPGVSMVRFVHLWDDERLDLLVCDMRFGMVFGLQPYKSRSSVRMIGRVPHPCTAEVVDLDRDGRRDVLVSDLGTVTPSDVLEGRLWWFRGSEDGKFRRHLLLENVGRIAHAQVADFDGDGDRDILVAVFGWRAVGLILLMINDTVDWSRPSFRLERIDPRPGTIHVPVCDLNADGKPDFVALISQHHETIVAFTNRGDGSFDSHALFKAEHPSWGATGIQLIDLDGDGDQDILCSNGDTLDDLLPKPYHGVQWLENHGALKFEHHHLTYLHGCNAARAGDLDGDGDLDIVACAFLPYVRPETPGADLTESLIWMEQVAPGKFQRYSLETVTCVHPCLDLGDFDADGDVDFVVGNMTMGETRPGPIEHWYKLYINLGP